ncbi:MAG: type 4a pilus biogenesis protein PilO [Methylococcales bacterium]|nr:type 4a pilus biogenesis protein PilO [Methylococcales bacterium]
MDLSEIDWDFNKAGAWPLALKIVTIILLATIIIGSGIYFLTMDQLTELELLEAKEVDLKQSFEAKQKKIINLPDYRDQFEQIELSLEEMIKQMPTQAEVANLLVDISQTGLANGLEFRLFKPSEPIRKDFYSELPINIKVIGKYQEIAGFISDLASLPRIVTIHNVVISPIKSKVKGEASLLTMNAIVKTYNEEEGKIQKKPKSRRR